MGQLVKFWAAMSLMLVAFSGCDHVNESNTEYRPVGVFKENKNYVIGINAFVSSKEMFVAYRPILNYLERNIDGVKFDLATSKDFVEYEKRVRQREFHFALSNPYQSVISFEYGYRPIAKMKNDTLFRGILISRKDAHITRFEQLHGKVIAFSAPTALAGAIMPKYFLWEHGIDVHRDMVPYYVGSHFSAILNTYTKDSLITATWPPAWEKWKNENPTKAAEMEIVWETEPLLNNALSVRSDVDPVLAAKVASLLMALNTTPQGRALLEQAGLEGFEKAEDKTFEPVRVFLHHYESALGKIQ
ncbi:phosphate/phosphite/phosphonate ABC transporter substrate-binding protein [Sulfuricurvum sp.]|uniref:phosphate/phosphite/phosphonate ABC transporter substrate-binding protein n=1 Tax=Sulfuricurvum sp. TaxID=2025608 RepID=UPI003C559FD6